MHITILDHLVLTVHSIEATQAFYTSVLGMQLIHFSEGRVALVFGQQKINLHQFGQEFEPKALLPLPGSADLCFLIDTPLQEAIEELTHLGIVIELGPLERTGATGLIRSFYIRDPDGNLLELANRLSM